MADKYDSKQLAIELKTKYALKVPTETMASILSANPKLSILLSRSAFRADAARSDARISTRRERRNFLRNVLGLVALSLPTLLWVKAAYFSPQAESPSYVSGSGLQSSGRLLTNAARVPSGESLAFNDPTLGPILLIHLTTGIFVAYSAICTHAGCTVQFDANAQDIACPCHGAVYDAYNNAAVLAGPAPTPLQKIPVNYDAATGNIYLAD